MGLQVSAHDKSVLVLTCNLKDAPPHDLHHFRHFDGMELWWAPCEEGPVV